MSKLSIDWACVSTHQLCTICSHEHHHGDLALCVTEVNASLSNNSRFNCTFSQKPDITCKVWPCPACYCIVTGATDSMGELQIAQHQLKQYEADSGAPQTAQLQESLERVQSLQGRLNSVEEQVRLLHVLGPGACTVCYFIGRAKFATCLCKNCALAIFACCHELGQDSSSSRSCCCTQGSEFKHAYEHSKLAYLDMQNDRPVRLKINKNA